MMLEAMMPGAMMLAAMARDDLIRDYDEVLAIEDGFAEPFVDDCAIAEHPLKLWPQCLQIEEAFGSVEDQHLRRPVERLSLNLSLNLARAHEDGKRGRCYPGEDGRS
jgi:hypothetical protein